MALTSTLGAGPLTSTKSFNMTNDKADRLLSAFIHGWADEMPKGLSVAEQGQWKLDQAHQKIEDYFRAEVARNAERIGEAQIEAVRAQIRADVEF